MTWTAVGWIGRTRRKKLVTKDSDFAYVTFFDFFLMSEHHEMDAWSTPLKPLTWNDQTAPWLLNDCGLYPVENSAINGAALTEFVTNSIFPHDLVDVLLPALSRIHAMVANKSAEFHLRDGESTWQQLLDPILYEALQKNGQVVLGYLLASDVDTEPSAASLDQVEPIRKLHFIDTRQRGRGLAEYMLDRFNVRYGTVLTPGIIIKSACGFWRRRMGFEDQQSAIEYLNHFPVGTFDWSHFTGHVAFRA